MASITIRKRFDGSTAHMAQIVIKRKGRIVHRENKTFDRRQAAYAWAAQREDELKAPGGLARSKNPSATLGDAIDRYVETSIKEIGRTKAQVLRSIKAYSIADLPCQDVASTDIVEFATELAQGRQPQTVGNYLSHLSSVFSIAKAAWAYELSEQAMRDALKVTKRLGLTSKSHSRDRRPTLDELDRLMQHFADRGARTVKSAPMHQIIAFALFSTRRQEEITRIAWADLNTEHKRILVRDMKNPGQKIGNNVWCDLPEPALAIIRAMPRTSGEIFPYKADTLSAAFTRACMFLGIHDLHFHDLRHEGITRLFEQGLNIPHVASVSGHRSWQALKRYTHIRQSGDKYEGWKWLPDVSTDDKHRTSSGAVPRLTTD
ncbi:MAG: site-specific integrase [Salinarimonadaceae bacterium]|nr:MAG: site-specific integrase [Salinarimonadaceae bacterium]